MMTTIDKSRHRLSLPALLCAVLLAGCAGTQTSGDPRDPWEPANRKFYAFNDALDKAILAPVAEQYVKLPEGLRSSVSNFFVNIGYPTTVINQFLQGKFEEGMEDTMRFVFNSTLGLGGLFDFASGIGLPRHQEDFGQTLAVWGVGEGYYINWPFLGPRTARSTLGIVPDILTAPLFYVESNAVLYGLAGLDLIDTRSRLIAAIRIRDETALDPYIFTREAYRQQRLNLIYDGNPPVEQLDEIESLERALEDIPASGETTQ